MKKIGIALAILSVFGLIGVSAASPVGVGSPVTVAASLTVPKGPECVLGVATDTGGGFTGTINPSSTPTYLYVANLGTSGWVSGNPSVASSMPVYVSGTNWVSNPNNGSWFDVGTTQVATNQYPGIWWSLDGTGTQVAYSAVTSGGSWSDSPIAFTAVAPGSAVAGDTYQQTITITGSC